jgi:hypothetical protein
MNHLSLLVYFFFFFFYHIIPYEEENFLITFYFKKALPIVFQVIRKDNEDEQIEIKLSSVDGWKRKQTRLRLILVDLLLTRAEHYHINVAVCW